MMQGFAFKVSAFRLRKIIPLYNALWQSLEQRPHFNDMFLIVEKTNSNGYIPRPIQPQTNLTFTPIHA